MTGSFKATSLAIALILVVGQAAAKDGHGGQSPKNPAIDTTTSKHCYWRNDLGQQIGFCPVARQPLNRRCTCYGKYHGHIEKP